MPWVMRYYVYINKLFFIWALEVIFFFFKIFLTSDRAQNPRIDYEQMVEY